MIKIEILGSGCPKCQQLAKNAELAAYQLGVQYELVKVTDINELIKYGIMMTPGLVINGEVKAVGKLLTVEQIKELLK